MPNNGDPNNLWGFIWRVVSSPKHVAATLALTVVAYVVLRLVGVDPIQKLIPAEATLAAPPAALTTDLTGAYEVINCIQPLGRGRVRQTGSTLSFVAQQGNTFQGKLLSDGRIEANYAGGDVTSSGHVIVWDTNVLWRKD